MKYVMIACWLLCAFAAGSWYHEYEYGEVRMFKNVVIAGDPMNHGQSSIDIKFPASIRPGYVWLPSGDIYPDDSKPRWVEILPDGEQKTWLDRLSLYVADDNCPTPGCRLGAKP